MNKWISILAIIMCLSKLNAQANIQKENYLPLTIGNQYEYYNGDNYFFIELKKDTLYNGKRYFDLPFPISGLNFVRTDTLGNIYSIKSMFSIYYGDTLEAFVVKGNSQPGDKWVVAASSPPLYDTIWGEHLYTLMGDVFNRPGKLKIVRIYNYVSTIVIFTFAHGIGITKLSYDDGSYESLDYAKIDGVTYGKLLDVKEIGSPPNSFNVSQNYPNPFNNMTRIDINIPKEAENPGELEFIISDILGNVIYRNKYSNKVDNQKLRIDLNADELKLASGIYFYTIRFGNSSFSRKMAFLK